MKLSIATVASSMMGHVVVASSTLASSSISANRLRFAAGGVGGRRRLSYEKIAGYAPGSQVRYSDFVNIHMYYAATRDA
jgi:hypothetical protein